jgi:DNA-binding response OmpR family regulator
MTAQRQPVLCLVDNLFFGARIEDAARRLGVGCTFARDADAFRRLMREQPPSLIVVDMGGATLPWQELLLEVRATGVRAHTPVLAFGRHTQSELFKLARRSGVDRAVTNAQLSEKLPELLREMLGMPTRST